MPILEPRPKHDSLELSHDAGLEYLESQRTWEHRRAPDDARAQAFLDEQARHPAGFPRSKRYPLAERIALSPQPAALEQSFRAILARRCTEREPGARNANASEVATLLCASFGLQSRLAVDGAKSADDRNALPWRRTMPSPGGLFASELYYLSLNTDGLQNGIYHFQAEDAVLERLPWQVTSAQAEKLFGLPAQSIEHAPAVSGALLVTSVFDRLRPKYGNKYLRFAILEAGILCQNLELTSTALELGLWHQGAVDEGLSRELLHIDGIEESVVYGAVLMGANRDGARES